MLKNNADVLVWPGLFPVFHRLLSFPAHISGESSSIGKELRLRLPLFLYLLIL
jgi:hypothetical protein